MSNIHDLKASKELGLGGVVSGVDNGLLCFVWKECWVGQDGGGGA